MKKVLGFIGLFFLYLSFASFIFVQAALADTPTPVQIPLEAPAGSVGTIDIQSIPPFVVTLLFVAGIIIAISFLVFGGIKWVTSGGDKAKVEAARGHIIAAIVGLVIIAAAFFILNIVFTLLTGKTFNLGNLCIPSLNNPHCAPISPVPTAGPGR